MLIIMLCTAAQQHIIITVSFRVAAPMISLSHRRPAKPWSLNASCGWYECGIMPYWYMYSVCTRVLEEQMRFQGTPCATIHEICCASLVRTSILTIPAENIANPLKAKCGGWTMKSNYANRSEYGAIKSLKQWTASDAVGILDSVRRHIRCVISYFLSEKSLLVRSLVTTFSQLQNFLSQHSQLQKKPVIKLGHGIHTNRHSVHFHLSTPLFSLIGWRPFFFSHVSAFFRALAINASFMYGAVYHRHWDSLLLNMVTNQLQLNYRT